MTISERLKIYLKLKKIGQTRFEKMAGLSNGYINGLRNAPGADKLQKILGTAKDLSREWLLTGEGDMLLREEEKDVNSGGIPYYPDVPVSAGAMELMSVTSDEIVGSINIPGVSGKYAFPVIGCSMEPVIHAGDIVVVDEVNRWERLDPDKIYLIFTRDDRMIKHIETDEENDEILWCVSPNYKRFSIGKDEVRVIFRVTFYGRLA